MSLAKIFSSNERCASMKNWETSKRILISKTPELNIGILMAWINPWKQLQAAMSYS